MARAERRPRSLLGVSRWLPAVEVVRTGSLTAAVAPPRGRPLAVALEPVAPTLARAGIPTAQVEAVTAATGVVGQAAELVELAAAMGRPRQAAVLEAGVAGSAEVAAAPTSVEHPPVATPSHSIGSQLSAEAVAVLDSVQAVALAVGVVTAEAEADPTSAVEVAVVHLHLPTR